MELPAQKPYLNQKHRFPVGNGIMMAVGDANGGWSRLAGPGYTVDMKAASLLESERIVLEVDGVDQDLTMDIHRAEKTGIYYGVKTFGDLKVALIDHAKWRNSWISRLVVIENLSPTTTHKVRVKALVSPVIADSKSGGGKWALVKNPEGADQALWVKKDTDRYLKKITMSVVIAFSDPAATAAREGKDFQLTTSLAPIPPKGSYAVALCHYGYKGDQADPSRLETIPEIDFLAELRDGISAWRAWYDNVGKDYKLERITDRRARDLLEGGLAVLKTNQSQDGGLIAHSTFFSQGYIRDAALGLRGFDATGHFEDSKRWIQWMQNRFESIRHIPTFANCGVALSDRGGSWDCNSHTIDMESTALAVLAARDYYRKTGDLKTLSAADGYIRYSMDAQLKSAAANDYRMLFNCDETEICGAVKIEGAGIPHGAGALPYWSMTSVALCAASLDFYIDYVRKIGEDPTKYRNSLTGTAMDLPAELKKLQAAMDRDFWRTDVPEIPAGFHDSFRAKADNSWPLKPISNFTLFPVYFGTPYEHPDRRVKDVAAMERYFNRATGFLQLVPGDDKGFDGHTLGYLLWGLLDVGDPKAEDVYKALVHGSTADCWGSFTEAYSADGIPNSHDLRTFETGCNLSAIAKYWQLGLPKR